MDLYKNQIFLLPLVLFVSMNCIAGDRSDQNSIEVVATAYNSLANQTNKNPAITAWGDKLKPGMKSIAVSRDLIALGLVHKTEVSIEGLPGTYTVLDKMNKKWKKRIDIYMGIDVKAAKKWGKKPVKISWKRNKK
ncbi:MAG: lipoprotein [Candidatus Scalindua sp.]|nr:3D domain-containing protein [Planctomycetota bacterium]GJQ57947.1 MAG: lipoprotein [Candidatus Scalindua sp.]